MSAVRAMLSRARQRVRHPSHVDRLYRARCECGWVGPVRKDEYDAHEDRGRHWCEVGA